LLCAAAAALADLGNLHRQHQIDSLTPALVSLQHWTLFFWCQDRVGMLVPLLALPIRDPLGNLLFQEAVYVFAGLAAMFLLARYVLRDPTYPLVGGVMAAAFLALAPAGYRFDFFNTTFYGVWLALGLAGLVLTEPRPDGSVPPRRLALAFLLLLLTHWAYSAAALALGPLVLLRPWFSPEPRQAPAQQDEKGARPTRPFLRRLTGTETGRALALLAGGFVGGLVLMLLSPYHVDYVGTLFPWQWLPTWRALAEKTWTALAPHPWPLGLLALSVLGPIVSGFAGARPWAGRYLRAAAALALTAAGYWFFMGTRAWISNNACMPRYILPSVFLLQGALVVVGVAPLAASLAPAARRGLHLGLVPLVLGAALAGYGPPSLAGVRADLDNLLGDCTEDILAARATHLAGNCFLVWPRVFHVNLVLHERGEPRQFFGLTYRTDATRDLWKDLPLEQLRVAVRVGDEPEVDDWLAQFGLPPLTVIEKRRTIWVLALRYPTRGRRMKYLRPYPPLLSPQKRTPSVPGGHRPP
jgi:hypothetical protein